MKKYEIEIDNEVYHVSVKELKADADMDVKTEKEEMPENETVTEPEVASGDTPINAPMAGTILNVHVAAGDSIKQGDVLITLEAMKMENEIIAPTDGTVSEVFVRINDSVESEQVLLTL